MLARAGPKEWLLKDGFGRTKAGRDGGVDRVTGHIEMRKDAAMAGKGDGEFTPGKHRGLSAPWAKGQSGNPAGRPKGARNKLGEAFAEALYADFQEHGISAIQAMRENDPSGYCRLIAGLLPREVTIDAKPLDALTDEQLASLIDALRLGDGDKGCEVARQH